MQASGLSPELSTMAPSEGVRGDSARPQRARPQSQGSVPTTTTSTYPHSPPKQTWLLLPSPNYPLHPYPAQATFPGPGPASRAHRVGSQVTSLGWTLAGSSPSCLHTALCLGPQLSSASPSPGLVSPEHETAGGAHTPQQEGPEAGQGTPPSPQTGLPISPSPSRCLPNQSLEEMVHLELQGVCRGV